MMEISYRIGLFLLGITSVDGYDDLSKDQNTMMLPTYHNCQPPCGPTTATDRNKETCTNTEAMGPSSTSKATLWSVDLGGNRSIYSIDILFKEYAGWVMRQKGRFAGFSLHISNTPKKEDGRLCYQNKLPLPPLKFNTTCIGYGRYVIYYNERLDGVTYPEGYQYQIYTQLCEVEVRGCTKAGVYGSNCNLPCPDNCQEKRCYIVNGTCFGCIPGWTGDMCNKKCPWGWYGLACKNKCAGHCIRNESCNHVTGRCEGSCADGWMGILCDEPCKNGYYGPDCVSNCSGHCLNNTYCSRETGHCDNGCNPGYTGEFCNIPCTPGFFGNNCYKQCSEKCKNNRCDNTDGTCIEGCLEGFVGRQCFNICEEGYFGTNCSNICSCNNSCQHIDGSCNRGEEKVVKLEAESTNASTIGGVLGAFVVIIVLVLLAVFFMRFKRKALAEYFEKSKKETNLPMELKEGKSSAIGNDIQKYVYFI